MKPIVVASFTCLLLAGCLQKQAAPIEYKGNYFFGRDGAYDRMGNELPKYSDYNPAPDSEYHADKFVGEEQRYGVSAEIGSVATEDLPPPEPVSSSPLPEVEQPTESVTVTSPAAQQIEAQHEFETAAVSIPEKTPPATSSAPTKFLWPLRGDVISHFGNKISGQANDGINIRAREGEPIRASADGVVVYADDEIKAYGNMAIIQHPGGYLTAYAHTSELVVKKGDTIVKGQLIGFVGKTGNVSTAQLHYSIRKDKQPVDPEKLLSRD